MRSKQEGLPGKTKRTRGKRARVGIFVALVVLAAAVFGAIALPRNSSQASQTKYRATKEIIRDDATGQLRKPTPEETDAIVAQISSLTKRPIANLPTKRSANGTEMMDLQGGSNGVVLGRATADGGTEVRCVFTLEEAIDFLGLEEAQ